MLPVRTVPYQPHSTNLTPNVTNRSRRTRPSRSPTTTSRKRVSPVPIPANFPQADFWRALQTRGNCCILRKKGKKLGGTGESENQLRGQCSAQRFGELRGGDQDHPRRVPSRSRTPSEAADRFTTRRFCAKCLASETKNANATGRPSALHC